MPCHALHCCLQVATLSRDLAPAPFCQYPDVVVCAVSAPPVCSVCPVQLSGGERSYTTVAFTLALGGQTEMPFRAMVRLPWLTGSSAGCCFVCCELAGGLDGWLGWPVEPELTPGLWCPYASPRPPCPVLHCPVPPLPPAG